LPGYRLAVDFVDGLAGEVDLSALIASPHAGVFSALRDVALFGQVRLDLGAVTWSGGLDLAPDAMHAAIKTAGVWRVEP
jgi:CubicO group peptidase (beta-lactamase class C family)